VRGARWLSGPARARRRRSDKGENPLSVKGSKTTVLSECALTEREVQPSSKRQVAGSSPTGVTNNINRLLRKRIAKNYSCVRSGNATPRPPHSADDHVAVALRSASGAIVPVPCGEETLDMVQHEAVVIGLGEGGSLLADVSSLFGSCCDCSGQNNLSVGQMGSHPTR
jgi:hypothetical protein